MATHLEFRTLKISQLFWPGSLFLGAWILLDALILGTLGMDLPSAFSDAALSGLLLAMACSLASHNQRYYQPKRGKYAYALVFTGVLTLIWLYLSNWVEGEIFHSQPSMAVLLKKAAPLTYLSGLIMTGWTTLVSGLWYNMGEQEESRLREETSQKLARDAELFKLRQQMNPHFLFNSLNSISSLMLLRPEQAREMIFKLSDYLRGTLKKEDQQLVTLAEELQYLQLYLDIEKIRFGHRLNPEISCSPEVAAMKLPVLLLQPVVENAIKFGLYDTSDEVTIRVLARKVGEELVLTVENPFDPETAGANRGTGFGLSAVSRRLYLLFARHDLLETSTSGNLFITRIKIPRIYDQSSDH